MHEIALKSTHIPKRRYARNMDGLVPLGTQITCNVLDKNVIFPRLAHGEGEEEHAETTYCFPRHRSFLHTPVNAPTDKPHGTACPHIQRQTCARRHDLDYYTRSRNCHIISYASSYFSSASLEIHHFFPGLPQVADRSLSWVWTCFCERAHHSG